MPTSFSLGYPHAAVTLDAQLTATATLTPPVGALIQQFLTNQVTDCSLICPSIVAFATQPLINFAAIPITFAGQLQSGVPLLQAIALTDATVSGAADAAMTGIITNDLNAALPRAQHALEVAAIALIRIGTTALTAPGGLPQAILTARADLFSALQQTPGPTPPAVRTAVEAATVRMIEVASALTFQAPEWLLLGVTQAANALFSTVGATGDLGAGINAVRTSVATTVSDSVGFIHTALNEPIPVVPAGAVTPASTNSIRLQPLPSPAATVETPRSKPSTGAGPEIPGVGNADKPRLVASAGDLVANIAKSAATTAAGPSEKIPTASSGPRPASDDSHRSAVHQQHRGHRS